MNRQESAKIIAVIVAACPGQSSRLDESRVRSMVDAFTSLLSDLTYEQCNAAVCTLLQTQTWMPSVADIRAAALELARGPTRAGAEAWGLVLKAIRAQGAYRRPGVDFVFNDPITERCVAALNWEELCLSENIVADRARFIDAYDKMAAQDRRESAAPMLAAARDARAALSGDATPIAQLVAKVANRD